MNPRVPAGISLDNWLSEPYSQWSFQHVEDFVPTAVISRGSAPAAALPAASAPVADIPVTRTDGVATTVGAVMATTATDGWAVAYRGSMVAEEYLDGLGAQTRHLLFSVSKSLVAAVVGALHGAGAIEPEAPVTAYVPALANCGYAGATVRHLLDMRSGIAFSDNYLHPTAEIHLLDESIGWAPKSSPDGPASLRDFLLTLRRKSAHGGPFEYRSCETDVLGWICEVAGGKRMPELMSELLWSRIGAQMRRHHRRGHGRHRTIRRRHQRLPSRHDPVRVTVLARRCLVDRPASGAGGVDRRHARWRARLASGVRRQPRRHPNAWRDVPQPSVVSLPGQQRRVVPGHVWSGDLRQPRRARWSPPSYPPSTRTTRTYCWTRCAHSMRWHTPSVVAEITRPRTTPRRSDSPRRLR